MKLQVNEVTDASHAAGTGGFYLMLKFRQITKRILQKLNHIFNELN